LTIVYIVAESGTQEFVNTGAIWGQTSKNLADENERLFEGGKQGK